MSQGEEAFKGAAGGAATGAALGSIVPGIGTGIGAGVGAVAGGLAGWFGGSDDPKEKRSNFELDDYAGRRDRLNGEIAGAMGVGTPMARAARMNPFERAGDGAQFRLGQEQLIGQLQAQAAGQGPSLAQAMFDRANQSNIAAQTSLARTGRGNTALAGRMAAQNIGAGVQGFAGQAAQARMQEQDNARQMLAGVLGQARGQSIGAAQFDAGQANQRAMQLAGFQQQTNLANQDAELRNRAQQQQYANALRDLELRNALAQQSGSSAFALGQGPTLGDQLMAGGTNALAMAYSSGAFGKPKGGAA